METSRLARTLTRDPAASMADLAAAAGVSRATLHRRFPRRHDLLAHLAEHAAQVALDAVATVDPAGAPLDRLRSLTAALVPLGDDWAFLLAAPGRLDDVPVVREATAAVLEAFTSALADGRRAGLVREGAPLGHQTRVALALTLATWESVQAGDLGPSEAVRVTVDGLTGALTRVSS